jgi:quercetin dioxygenase-like cupin family protein
MRSRSKPIFNLLQNIIGLEIMKVIKVEEANSTILEPGRATKPLIDATMGANNVQVVWMEAPVGWKSDRHSRDVEEVLYVLSGKCAIYGEGERYEATAGTIIFIPPGEVHQHENIGTQTFAQLVIFAPPLRR